MKQNSFSKKRIIHICVIISILIMLIVIVSALMLKYHIEGEQNLPFNLSEISIVSTAESDITQNNDGNWNARILQKNDIFFVIEKNDNYKYSDENKVQNSLEYLGAQNTNTETLQINNQGGIIGFSVASDNLGEYIFSKDEKLPSDGRLLAKAGVKAEEMNFKISFDIIIETESGHKFKSNIVLDLPTGNILEEGVGTLEDTELNDVIFKRF